MDPQEKARHILRMYEAHELEAAIAEAIQNERSRAAQLSAERDALHQTIIQMRDSGHELPGTLMRDTFRWEEKTK